MKAIRDIIISEVEPPVNNVGWLKPLSNGNFMLFFFTRKGWMSVSAPSITVDTTISDTSTNPVQNKVIKAYIDGLVGNVAAQLAQI